MDSSKIGAVVVAVLGVALTACIGEVGSAPASPGERAVPGADAGAPAEPPATGGEMGGMDRELRRLTSREMHATLDALFPEIRDARPSLSAGPSEVFDNDIDALDTSLEWIDELSTFAAAYVRALRADPGAWSRVRVCTTDDGACLADIARHWGLRLHRRPMLDTEVDRIVSRLLADDVITGFDERVEVLFEALLQDPETVFRIEPAGHDGIVDDYSIASRLSYALWGRAPDDALLERARRGELRDSAARAAVAAEMLRAPQAHEHALRFHAQWLGFSALPRRELGVDMWNETEQLVERVVFERDEDYHQLFLSEESYLTPALAEHYGVDPPPGAAAGWVRVSDAARRGSGILGHGTYLSVGVNIADASAVKRGKQVLQRLLCVPPIVVPPDVDVDVRPRDGMCHQEFLSTVHAAGSCAGCHEALDGIGFGLDRFDRFGAARTHEPERPDCPLDGQGSFFGAPFAGASGLASLLVDEPRFDPCTVRQVLRFTTGADVEPSESSVHARLLERYLAEGRSLRELLVAIVSDPAFVRARAR